MEVTYALGPILNNLWWSPIFCERNQVGNQVGSLSGKQGNHDGIKPSFFKILINICNLENVWF